MAKTASEPSLDDVFGERGYDPTQFGEQESVLDKAIAATPSAPVMQFVTKQKVDVLRDIPRITKQFMEEARIAGESFYYSWSVTDKRSGRETVVEGPSVDLCLAAARCWGNCVVEVLPLQEDGDAWVITTRFIDLETGFNVSRPFRQSKHSVVFGNLDPERKNDTRFQVGVSKSQRNVIRRAVPPWLINQAMIEAKKGVRETLSKAIQSKGIAVVIDRALKALATHGIDARNVLAKFAVTTAHDLTLDHLVRIKGDLAALEAGQEFPDVLYPGAQPKAGGIKGENVTDALGPKKSSSKEAPRSETASAPATEPPRKKKKKKRPQPPPPPQDEPDDESEDGDDEPLPAHDEDGEVIEEDDADGADDEGDGADEGGEEDTEEPEADGEDDAEGDDGTDADAEDEEAAAAEEDGFSLGGGDKKRPSQEPPRTGGGRGVSEALQAVLDDVGKCKTRGEVSGLSANLGDRGLTKEEIKLAQDACEEKFNIIRQRAQEGVRRNR